MVSLCRQTGLTWLVNLYAHSTRLRGSLIRSVNYHGTPAAYREQLAAHFEYYRHKFTPVSEHDLLAFIEGDLQLKRQGIIVTFDDGLRNHYTVALNLLDEFGLKGIFFLPVRFIDLAHGPDGPCHQFFHDHIRTDLDEIHRAPEDRLPMSWEQAKEIIERGHAVGCHTMNHQTLGDDRSEEFLRLEIVWAKAEMEQRLGQPVNSFCWPVGQLGHYGQKAMRLVRQHYRLAFSNFAVPLGRNGNPHLINRANVEANYSLPAVRFGIGGLEELWFLRRWQRVQNIVAGNRK